MEHDRYLVQNKTIVTRTKAEFWGALTLASRVSHHRPRVPAGLYKYNGRQRACSGFERPIQNWIGLNSSDGLIFNSGLAPGR